MHLNPVNGYWRSSMLDPEIFKEIEKEDRVYMIFGTVGILSLIFAVLLMLYIIFF
jgi:hypothetical protein